jgi:hypothetical protein
LQRRWQVVEHDLDLPAQHVVERRPRTLVWNVDHVGPGCAEKQFAHHVPDAGLSARSEAPLARLLLQQGDEFLHILRGDRRMHHEDVRDRGQVGDRNEIGQRLVGELRVRGGIDRVRRDGRDAQRVSVRRRLRDEVGADAAAGPGAIVDDDRLPELLRELVGDEPRDDVGRATRRERNDEPDRLRRIVLRCRELRQRDHRREREDGNRQARERPESEAHAWSP